MARRGRPSKGPRDFFRIALTEALGQRIRRESAETGKSHQIILSQIIADHYGMPAENPDIIHIATWDEVEHRMTG